MPESISDWIGTIAGIGMILFGGGGFLAWRKFHNDKKVGVQQETRADVDSFNARAVAMIETQFNFLVKPLQEELVRVNTKLELLQKEVQVHKDLYGAALLYIRVLYDWIARHLPKTDLEEDDVPRPPPTLADDLK